MSPLCSSCRSDAEQATTGRPDSRCSRCGEPCDNCGGVSPLDIPTSPGARVGGLSNTEALRDPVVAFILGMATMGLVCSVMLVIV